MKKFAKLSRAALLILVALVSLICINNPPVKADEDNPFHGDEKYRIYPYEKTRLKTEQVILNSDVDGNILKIYHYNRGGQLDAIHLPAECYSLLIEKTKGKYQYFVAKKHKVYLVYGGSLDNFNAEYAGKGGISDTLLSEKHFKRIVKTTKKSLNSLEKAITRYEKQTGQTLTVLEYGKPANIIHPLSKVKGMNLTYFFDGHGQRLHMQRTGEHFSLISPTLATDLEQLRLIRNKLSSYRHTQKVVLGIIGAIFLCVVAMIILFFRAIERVIDKFRGKITLK